jgi:hypothetical protein
MHPRPPIFPWRRPTTTVLRSLINLLARIARATVTYKREGINIDVDQGALMAVVTRW